jgi:hypothetical protein
MDLIIGQGKCHLILILDMMARQGINPLVLMGNLLIHQDTCSLILM